MTFNASQLEALAAPLNRDVVKQRKQGNQNLSYVEAWHAIAEANRIFGFDGWNRETVLLTQTNCDLVELKGERGPYKQWRVGYVAKVRVTVGGVIREGTGFGSGMGKPEALGDAIESAVKEAESDAMKRALMTFGNPFGLALYDKEQANVADTPAAPTPYETAQSHLIGATSGDEFKAIWARIQANRNAFSNQEYAQLVDLMKREAGRWKPQQSAIEGVSTKPQPEERSFAMSEEEIQF